MSSTTTFDTEVSFCLEIDSYGLLRHGQFEKNCLAIQRSFPAMPRCRGIVALTRGRSEPARRVTEEALVVAHLDSSLALKVERPKLCSGLNANGVFWLLNQVQGRKKVLDW